MGKSKAQAATVPPPPQTLTPRSYFLECRKDTQCSCSMCQASLSATLDIFGSGKGSSKRGGLSSSHQEGVVGGKENRWPPEDGWDTFCTPPLSEREKRRHHLSASSSSTSFRLSSRLHDDSTSWDRQRRGSSWKALCWVAFGLLSLALLEYAIPLAFHLNSSPAFTALGVGQIGKQSMVRRRLVDRLDFVERKLSLVLPAVVSVLNCTGSAAKWNLVEDEMLVHSRCSMHSSTLETVSVWGYPAKTGGILGRSLVDRSFIVLSGRVLEWQEGQVESTVYPEGSQWSIPKWAASVISLDADTWVLEYRRTPLSEGLGSVAGFMHLAKCATRMMYVNLKLHLDSIFISQAHFWKIESYYPPTIAPPT